MRDDHVGRPATVSCAHLFRPHIIAATHRCGKRTFAATHRGRNTPRQRAAQSITAARAAMRCTNVCSDALHERVQQRIAPTRAVTHCANAWMQFTNACRNTPQQLIGATHRGAALRARPLRFRVAAISAPS